MRTINQRFFFPVGVLPVGFFSGVFFVSGRVFFPVVFFPGGFFFHGLSLRLTESNMGGPRSTSGGAQVGEAQIGRATIWLVCWTTGHSQRLDVPLFGVIGLPHIRSGAGLDCLLLGTAALHAIGDH